MYECLFTYPRLGFAIGGTEIEDGKSRNVVRARRASRACSILRTHGDKTGGPERYTQRAFYMVGASFSRSSTPNLS